MWQILELMLQERVRKQGYSEQLSRTGDNLSSVTKYIYDNYPDTFETILKKMKQRVPGVDMVEAQETQDGYIVLRFQDGKFKIRFHQNLYQMGR